MQKDTIHLWNQLTPKGNNPMRSSLLRLIAPAGVVMMALLFAYEILGLSVVFIIPFALVIGWILGRAVEI